MAPVLRPGSTTDAPAPAVPPVDTHGALPDTHAALPDTHGMPDTHAARPDTEDRGAFTHGTCGGCGWSGPGRRARAVAARDAVRHLQTGCAGEVTTTAHDHAAR